ncbi:MAG: GH3 family acyl-acid amido synthetase [Planctomycetota bacterium]
MIGRVLYWRAAHRIRSLARQGRDPEGLQRDLLLRLVRRARETRFGREHDFAAIRSVADFRARVPVQDHASMRPYFERARDGAPDETWPGPAEVFVVTSGTGNFLPHTRSSLKSSLDGGSDALAAYLVRAGDRHLLQAKIAFLGGSVALDRFASGMPWGENTGILATRAPGWVRPYRVPSADVLSLDDWEEKLTAATAELARCDVRLLLGVPSWSLLLIDAVERQADRPIRDVWPSWRGFIHGGMVFAPYAETYRKRVGKGVVFVDTYTVTEGGVLAVQDRDGDPSLAVIPDRNVFFEFVRAEEPQSPRLGLHEVEPGVPYLVHVTTDAGLWAHEIGDIVRFTNARPPRLLFHGRKRFFLDAFGEHVSLAELERAVADAARAHGCEVREFTVLPEFPDARRASGRHAWLVEFIVPPPDLSAFAGSIDAALRRGNREYRSHRDGDRQLLPPVVRLVRSGAFYDWMKRRGRLGGQHRVPRIMDRELAQGILPGTG